MKKAFRNSIGVECIFTDGEVNFYDKEHQVIFPYGCITSIRMGVIMGVLQIASNAKICNFAVDRKDRAEMKEVVKFVQNAMTTAPKAEAKIIDLSKRSENELVSADLPAEEQLKRYKMLFVQGVISKQEYEARKIQLENR